MKKNILALVVAIVSAMIMTGCATMFGGGSKQDVIIQSAKPVNMTLHYVDNEGNVSDIVQTFKAPATIKVTRENKDILIKSADNNCQDTKVEKKTNNWFWGNVIATSPLSTTVDAVTGAMWEYDKEVIVQCK